MNIKTPSHLLIPSYVLNFPFTVDNHTPNNPLMYHNPGAYDRHLAFKQFIDLYSAIVSNGGLVYLLPSEKDLQDLPYTANIGAYLPHLSKPTILLSNFKSEPRRGEEEIGKKFFESMRYTTHVSPYHWEGEADLKWIRDDLYIAGHGIRSDIRSYFWFSEKFNMKIIPIKMTDPRLYHFDCMFFPISDQKALVATEVIDSEGIRQLERYIEIIDVPKQFIYSGWTNALRLNNKILYNIPISEDSWKALDSLIIKLDLEPVGIDLGEYDKSGADLSCFILSLNHMGRYLTIGTDNGQEIKSKTD